MNERGGVSVGRLSFYQNVWCPNCSEFSRINRWWSNAGDLLNFTSFFYLLWKKSLQILLTKWLRSSFDVTLMWLEALLNFFKKSSSLELVHYSSWNSLRAFLSKSNHLLFAKRTPRHPGINIISNNPDPCGSHLDVMKYHIKVGDE